MVQHSPSKTGLPYNIPLGGITLSLYGEDPWGMLWAAWIAMPIHEQQEGRAWVLALSFHFLEVEFLSLTSSLK